MKMRGRTALFLATRLRWRTDDNRKKSPSVAIAVCGVALSVMVMMLSVAVVLGFQKEVKTKLMEMDDAITVTAWSADGTQEPIDLAELMSLIELPSAATVTEHVSTAAILKTDDDFMAINLDGAERYMSPDSVNAIIVSSIMATRLGLTVGDKIPAYFFIDNRLRTRSLRVDSIYSTGVDEHDAAVAYCSPSLPRRLLGLKPDEASSVGISGLRPEEIEPLAGQIGNKLLHAYYSGSTNRAYGLTTILQTDAVYFTWLDLLDTNVTVILTLMAAVAAFTLISSLFIIILERVKTIGLLKSIGATDGLIRRTFMLMAERLVIKGLIIGNAVALILIAAESMTHAIPLDPASYYVDYVPVKISVSAILMLNCGALLLSWLVLMLPAMIISRISPASTMRYE